MSEHIYVNMPWLLFKVSEQNFAVPSCYAKELITVPRVNAETQFAPYMVGQVSLQGKPIPLLDLSIFLQRKSLIQEIVQLASLLKIQEHYYMKWLHEIELLIETNQLSKAACRPCPMQQSLKEYKPVNPFIALALAGLVLPHKALMTTHGQLLDLIAENKKSEALRLVRFCMDGHLERILDIYREINALTAPPNLGKALVLEYEQVLFAVTVDCIAGIDSPVIQSSFDDDNKYWLEHASMDNGSILLLDVEQLAMQCHAMQRFN